MARRIAEHGRHIFVYNHLWTGQTIYSLDRTLNVHTHASISVLPYTDRHLLQNTLIQQLPYAGKKTIPAGIRKDVWRPLLTVSFPSVPQGLHAYRKLREFRKLHELSWDKPTVVNNGLLDLDNPYIRTEKPRLPKKERSRMIMDQRANSIADLAAVLRQQEEAGIAKENQEIEKKEAEEQKVREEMVALLEEEKKGGLRVIEAAINAQKTSIRALLAKRAAGESDALSRKNLLGQTRALKALELKLQKMKAAKEVFDQGHARLVQQAQSAEEAGESSSQLELDVDPPRIFYHSRHNTPFSTIPKRGPVRKALARTQTPIYTAQGVVIRWSNPLDAEIAESWPAAVQHQDAGLLKHVAADPTMEPVFDVERVLRSPKALRELSAAEQAELEAMDGGFMQEPKLSQVRA